MKLVAVQRLDTDRVRLISPEIEVVSVDTNAELLREAGDAEIVYGVGADVFQELLGAGSSLRWAHTSTVGADRYISDLLREKAVTLTCGKGGAAGRSLAEHALGLTLALSRNIAEAARAVTWRRSELGAGLFELSGRTAGIAGYGAAGHALARLLSGFEMTVYAIRRHSPFTQSDLLHLLPPEALPQMCAVSDVVFNFLPATHDTHRVFGRPSFEAMKPSALFVNVGRGSTVDTDALVAALREGLIAGAGIDTVEPEPLPDGHPLWSMRNVVISPHIAGTSPDRRVRNEDAFLDNLKRYLSGRPLLNAVDPEGGY